MDAHPAYVPPVAWFGITFGTFWVALLGHEAAHFAVAHFVYAPGALSTGDVAPRHQLLVVGAGPAFTLVMIVACAAASSTHRTWARAIAIAAIAFGVSRLVVIAPATLLNRGMNDERTVAHVVNVFPPLLWIAEALVAIAAVAFAAGDGAIPRQGRSVLAIAGGLIVGWVSAFTLGRAIGLPI